MNETFAICLFHSFPRPPPYAPMTFPLISQVRSVGIWIGQITESVSAARLRVRKPIKCFHIIRVMFSKGSVPCEFWGFREIQDHVMVVWIGGESQSFRICPSPNYFAEKII